MFLTKRCENIFVRVTSVDKRIRLGQSEYVWPERMSWPERIVAGNMNILAIVRFLPKVMSWPYLNTFGQATCLGQKYYVLSIMVVLARVKNFVQRFSVLAGTKILCQKCIGQNECSWANNNVFT